jgi:hypothetical protein
MDLRLHVKYPLFWSDLDETEIFSTDFRKNTQNTILTKIFPIGTDFFHVDGQTDMTKLIVAFRGFSAVPKIDFGYCSR